MPYETNFSGLSLEEANNKYALKAGSQTQTFNCDVLNCNSIASRNNADIGMITTSLIGDHLYFKTNPGIRSAPANTTSVADKFAAVESTIKAPHTLLTGIAKDWLNDNEVFVHWSGEPILTGLVPSILAPVELKLKRLTMRYYSSTQAALTGGTTCVVSLVKFSTSHASANQQPVSLLMTTVATLFTFDATNAGSGHPAVSVDLSTLNSGSTYNIAQNESLAIRFARNIVIGHDPASGVKEADIQCCLHCELGS
jgi:hypothetical protein